jgi:hypothetical protein
MECKKQKVDTLIKDDDARETVTLIAAQLGIGHKGMQMISTSCYQ